MSDIDRRLIIDLIAEEIRRLVAESIEDGGCLPAGRCASLIARAYPNSGLSGAEIAERIVQAAVHARITVEMSTPPLARQARA